ncbi:MAG TPA: alpha/beta hydrolase [Flavisolibacter sp.]
MTIINACQGKLNMTPADSYLPEQHLLNISYGKDTLQRMDAYLPAGRNAAQTKSLVLIHGGGWTSGSKSDLTAYIDSLKKRLPDYAIFNINYRLVNGGNLFPSQEMDVKSAVEHIKENAAEYAISADKMVLLGASAGGHLAMLHAYKYKEPSVRAVINFFGPADLVTMYRKPWHPMVPFALQMITGTTPSVNAQLYHESSPVHYVSSTSAPTLIFHGSRDPVVDISQSRILKKKLEAAGVHHELVVYPGQRHGWYGATLSNSFDRIEGFLRATVK